MKTTSIVCALLVLLSAIAVRPADFSTQTTIIDLKIPDGLGRVALTDQRSVITVQVTIEERRPSDNGSRVEAAKHGLQVWLLKGDGSVAVQKGVPVPVRIGNGLGEATHVMFSFAKIPLNEISGVVMRKDGKLYCGEFSALQNQSR